MQLSIIIVNYNVKNYIDLCLTSVEEAIKDIEVEVFVVDNNSSDNSVEFLRKHYTWVKLIENKENIGFSRANNQAAKKAKGKYILLLNPDTIIAEDTLEKCVGFMNKTPQAGGLGVKMIGIDGKFQPESKRGIPTPAASFFKMSGLSGLFPNSKFFSRYNLSYLPENKTNEIQAISGAFMFLRREALDKAGLLDETFFMYGEDIDLSYRILKSGYKNYYFPKTQILHFKGESTKKNSEKYINDFYGAMLIFTEKHFKNVKCNLLPYLIKLIIKALIVIKIFSLKLQNNKRTARTTLTEKAIYLTFNEENTSCNELKQLLKLSTIEQFTLQQFNNSKNKIISKLLKTEKKHLLIISYSIEKKEMIKIINSLSHHKINIYIYNHKRNYLFQRNQ